MRTGGYSFFGGTAYFGGSDDAESRWYRALKRMLGSGAYEEGDSDPRSRALMVLGRMCAIMENEAKRQHVESVPVKSITSNPEWQKIFYMKYLAGVYGDTWLAQRFLGMIQRFAGATPNIRRIENEVGKIMDAAHQGVGGGGGLGVEGFENTRAIAIGDDAERFFCVLVPSTVNMGYGPWLIKKTQRPLYRAIKRAIKICSPAHTVGALSTVDAGTTPNRPAWYSNGYRGTGYSKDCVGS